MPTFEYQALTPTGRLMKGTLEASDREEAARSLAFMQLGVQSLEKAKVPRAQTAIGRNEFLLFNRQLASLTKAGIPLERGLRELSGDVSSGRMRKLILSVADDLDAGESIERAFEKRQANFPPLYSHIVRAGVRSGRLSEMLNSLNRHLEMSSQTRRIVFEAACYPAVILVLAVTLISAVFIALTPHLVDTFGEFGPDQLPAITRMLVFAARHALMFWAILGGLLAAAAIALAALSGSPAGRRSREALLMRIPILGRIYRRSRLSRMADAMATLVGAGCGLPEALRLAAGAAGSQTLVNEAEGVARRIEHGANIVDAGQSCRMIPPLFLYSAELGSQRNELQDNLYGLSEMYADQARSDQGTLQALLMPALVVLVGGVVCVFIFGIFAPFCQVLVWLQR